MTNVMTMTNAVIECNPMSRSVRQVLRPSRPTWSDDLIRRKKKKKKSWCESAPPRRLPINLQNWRFIAVLTPEAKRSLRPNRLEYAVNFGVGCRLRIEQQGDTVDSRAICLRQLQHLPAIEPAILVHLGWGGGRPAR